MFTFKSVFLATILLKLVQFGESYIITIDARAQDCFYEHGPKMSKFFTFVYTRKDCITKLKGVLPENLV